MVKELEYTAFYENAHKVITHAQDSNNYNGYEEDFLAHEFFGRTNKLSFKLCHDYCNTCYEIGVDINHQNCVSCLEQYTYDY